ncbi:MAG TPA: alanine--tRNA ligase [Armatimonadota bacterium]|nr:alanine--tRNA ligase [Armatimonadota bacterium]
MTGNELREAFLRYFEERGHKVLPSSPLVLPEDPSTLFTSAGMQPFSPVFRGEAPAPAPRVATCQKVFREGDLEIVGATGRHHTFFEMLGNFSFGDYFKREAVEFGWEFSTQVLKLPPDKLWFTVYEEDDETAGYWQEVAGVGPERVVRLGKEDNWWPQTAWNGPCGPCSEIYLDRGPEWGCGGDECRPGCKCDRFMEFWNLVFQMYLQDETGTILSELPRFGIDTGMGLERAACLVMDVPSIFETDLGLPIVERLLSVLRDDENLDLQYTPIREVQKGVVVTSANEGPPDVFAAESGRLRGISDHARAATFLIADGIRPSADGRGSVLRRLIRRSFGHGWRLGVQNPFLYKCVVGVVQALGQAYPEIIDRQGYIEGVIRAEEELFRSTVESGMQLLSRELDRQSAAGQTIIPGDTAFTLATTHGFPSELTRDVADQYGFVVDWDNYEKLMEEHRKISADPNRVARGQFTPGLSRVRNENGSTVFTGYTLTSDRATVLALTADGLDVENLTAGQEGVLVLDYTPFYAEAGGQVGDSGVLTWDGGSAEVLNTTRVNDLWLHQVRVTEGALTPGTTVGAVVDTVRRKRIMRNHTATHLMHAALRQVLGSHATQSGSLVAPDRLRFDFSHTEPLTGAQIQEIERLVQDWIDDDIPVVTSEHSLEEARSLGAMALFGEKYGERVRVVQVAGEEAPEKVSLEFCGGTHVSSTGTIGLFHITSESGVGAGLRRIEAVTGPGAVAFFRERDEALRRAADQLRCSPEVVPNRVERVQQQFRDMTKQRDQLLLSGGQRVPMGQVKTDSLTMVGAGSVSSDASVNVGGVSVVAERHDGLDADALGKIADQSCSRLGSGVVVYASVVDGRVLFVSKVSSDLTGRGVHAGKLVSALAAQTGGGGGGRPDFAQAGGRSAEAVDAALAAAPDLVAKMLGP